MTKTSDPRQHRLQRRIGTSVIAAVALIGSAGLLAACSGSSTTDGATNSTSNVKSSDQVLPVTDNPITNAATTEGFTIDSVLVENNVNASGSGDAPDHLEISVTNTSGAELGGFEVFYTIDDPTTNISEGYYAALPTAFTVAPGASRAIHFDNTGEPDHFPVNDFSLYYTDSNALDVTVEVSATGAAPQTVSVQKDEGGVEVPD